MNELITSKIYEKPEKRKGGWNPPAPAMDRIRRMTDDLLGVMEGVLLDKGITTNEKFDRLFGARGLMANLPKLVQILEELKTMPDEDVEEEAISDEDIALMRGWLQLQGVAD